MQMHSYRLCFRENKIIWTSLPRPSLIVCIVFEQLVKLFREHHPYCLPEAGESTLWHHCRSPSQNAPVGCIVPHVDRPDNDAKTLYGCAITSHLMSKTIAPSSSAGLQACTLPRKRFEILFWKLFPKPLRMMLHTAPLPQVSTKIKFNDPDESFKTGSETPRPHLPH